MCLRCRMCYKWLKRLPVDGKQHYKEVQRDQITSTHNNRPYRTGPRQQSSLVAPPDTRMQSKGKRPLYETRPPNYYKVNNQLERKYGFSAGHGTRTDNSKNCFEDCFKEWGSRSSSQTSGLMGPRSSRLVCHAEPT